MTHHRVRGVLAAALSLAVLAACSGEGAGPEERQEPPPAGASSDSEAPASEAPADEGSDGPASGPVVNDPVEPDLDLAVSTPREDSVYPAVGDPRVDALHYELDLTWAPDAEHLTGAAVITFRAARTARRFQLDLGAPLTVGEVALDGEPIAFARRGKDLVAAGADRGGPALRAQPRLRRHARARPRPDHAQRLQHDRLHGDPQRRGVDDAGARTAPTPGTPSTTSRPTRRSTTSPSTRRRGGPGSPTASSPSSRATRRARPRPGSSTSRRRRTSSRSRSATTSTAATPPTAGCGWTTGRRAA